MRGIQEMSTLSKALRALLEEHFHLGNLEIATTQTSADGSRKFATVTGANVGRRLAIILDGNVYSAPVIQERISGGEAQITGSFTPEEATDLAIVLRAGSLPAPTAARHPRGWAARWAASMRLRCSTPA